MAKFIYFSICSLFVLTHVLSAQITVIPDTNFEQSLIDQGIDFFTFENIITEIIFQPFNFIPYEIICQETNLYNCFFLHFLTLAYSQNPSHYLQDLVGIKGSYAELDLEKRGYVHIKTDKSGYDVYSSWWNSRKKKCVTYHLSDGRVQSIVDVPSADCNRSGGSHQSGNHGYARTDDIVGLSVDSASERLGSRGFKKVDQFKKDGKTHRIYYNNDTRQCVDVRSMHGKVGHVQSSERCK